MKLLIDGDLLVHRFCAACQEMSPFNKEILLKACPDETWHTITLRLEQLVTICEDHFDEDCTFVLTFSDKANYRKTVDPNYKSNRKGVAKPVLFHDMVDKCRRVYETETWLNIEADDVMGLMQDENTVIVTGDKDLRQIAGYHLNLIYPENGIEEVTKDEGYKLLLKQTLAGDSVDGFYGCPRVGMKTAEKLLEEYGYTWNTVVDTYRKAVSPKSKTITSESGRKTTKKLRSYNLGLGADDALRTARLAYILRNEEDYNKETGEVNLWNPE